MILVNSNNGSTFNPLHGINVKVMEIYSDESETPDFIEKATVNSVQHLG